MKYSLINCYSDNNKGDLGIILSTIKLLREYDKNASIKAISTYNYNDPLFISEHELLKKEVDVFPSVFGELNIGNRKGIVEKLICFVYDLFRLIISLLFRTQIVFNKYEKKSITILKKSDYIISKGGSFLCNEQNIRDKIALIRFCFIILLSLRLCPNSKFVILCQSLGPIYGRLSQAIINYILKRAHYVVLREKECLSQYRYLKIPNDRLFLVNDIAFFLNSDNDVDLDVFANKKTKLRVGVTIKTMDKNKNEVYINMMKESIEYLIEKTGAIIYIYPHVTISDDLEASYRVFKRIKDCYKKNIIIFTNNYTSQQLKFLYGQMDFFIASRLHSAIFAIGELTPVIVIAYHGTKSQGVFDNIGMKQWVLTEYSCNILIELIDSMLDSYSGITKDIPNMLRNEKAKMMLIFSKIFLNNGDY